MIFNKKDIYNENIKEKVEALILACRLEKIPCFISIAVENNENSTTYKSDAITPNSLGLNLKDDKISHHINVLNGFNTVPYTELIKNNSNNNLDAVIWKEGMEFEEIVPN